MHSIILNYFTSLFLALASSQFEAFTRFEYCVMNSDNSTLISAFTPEVFK